MADCSPVDRIITNVKTRVPGVTDDLINLELFNTMNVFFRRTNAWRYEQEIALVVGEPRYEIFPPNDTALVRVLGMAYNGAPMHAAAVGGGGSAQSQRGRMTADEMFVDGDAGYDADAMVPAVSTGTPFRYAIFFPTYVAIDVQPDQQAATHPMYMMLALTLASSCLECDCGEWGLEDWMYDMFFEDFLDGVVARLYSMPSKPWGNPTMAAYHGKRFRQAMAFRRQESRRGYVNDSANWRYPVGGFLTRR